VTIPVRLRPARLARPALATVSVARDALRAPRMFQPVRPALGAAA